MNEIDVKISIDVDKIITQIENEINGKLNIFKNEKELQIDNQTKYIQKPNCQKQKYNNVNWKFDYFYDFENRGKSKGIHGISADGKTFECKCDDKYTCCQCFSRISFGMKPDSGVYKIKFKINNIDNQYPLNAIGITCNTHETNNSQYKSWWFYSHDYITWSSKDSKGNHGKNVHMPNGLICGYIDACQSRSIFTLSKFKYMSNNNSYLEKLPGSKSGDIIEMVYNSNTNQLSLFKSNDKLLNSKVVSTPDHQSS